MGKAFNFRDELPFKKLEEEFAYSLSSSSPFELEKAAAKLDNGIIHTHIY